MAANYLTRSGALRMQEELVRLRTKERPKIVGEVADAAAQGDRSENAEYIYGKKKLREIDRRVHYLTKRLETATVVDPDQMPASERARVFFGATVVVEDEEQHRSTYRVVGEDEIDLKKGHISWRSPLGSALLKKRVGDTFTFRRPSGELELTVISIAYEA